jgi:chromate reductase, NAD(P)H dehydrogenase (quinone)
MTTRILGMAGSLRAESYNRKLLEVAYGLVPAGVEAASWDRLGELPAFNEDDEIRPMASVRALRAAIAAADAVLVATPKYNGSIPGALKNALDWASRPHLDNVLRGKPVAVIGASPGPGGAGRAQAEARAVLGRIGARVLDRAIEVPRADEQFDPAGAFVAPGLGGRLARLLDELASPTGCPSTSPTASGSCGVLVWPFIWGPTEPSTTGTRRRPNRPSPHSWRWRPPTWAAGRTSACWST